MSRAGTIHDSRALSGKFPALFRPSMFSTKSPSQPEPLTRGQRGQFCSLIFVSPFVTRTAAQIQSSSSIDRTSLRARTRALASAFEHRGRAGQVPSQSRGLLPVGFIAEADRSNRTRLSLGAHGPDRRIPMIRSNPINETNDPKTTAVSTSSHPVKRETNSEPSANSQSAAANTKQVPTSEFEFVRASQLREDALDREGDDRGGDR